LPRTADEFNTRYGAHLFDSFLGCPIPILVVSGLLLGENNLTTGCHRDSKPAYFSHPVCSSTEEAGKNIQTGFFE
jgi:hypothetical protein